MTTNLRDLILTPRAVAVLCTLRSGATYYGTIAGRIGDDRNADINALLRDMRALGLIAQHFDDSRWGLTHDGLGWLQLHGLDASESAKQALYAAADVQAVRS